MNVKCHKNCENTGKVLKMPLVRCNFVKFDIHFFRAPVRKFLWVLLHMTDYTLALKMRYRVNYSGTRFLSTES